MTPQSAVGLERAPDKAVVVEPGTNPSVGIAHEDLNGNYLHVDPMFCRITGHPDSALIGRSAAEITHLDDLVIHRDGIADLRAGRILRHDLDVRYVGTDGGVVCTSSSTTLVTGVDGTASHVRTEIREVIGRRPHHGPANDGRRLRETQWMGGLGSWEIDLATDRISRSEALLEILGMPVGDQHRHYAHTRSQVVHPDDRDRVRDAMRALLVEGAPMRMRYRITRPAEGIERWVDARGERFSVEGVPVRAAGTVVDVTEVVLAEAVRASQASALGIARHQDALLSTLVQGVIVIRADGVITTINEAAASIGGLQADQVEGMTGLGSWWGAVDEDGVSMAPADLPATRALRDGVTVHQTIGIRGPDGIVRWQDVTAVPILDAAGRPEYVVIGLSDVTEARRAKRALSVSEERFRLAFDNAPVGMAMVDLSEASSGRLRRVNAALCAFAGRSREDLESAALMDISHPDEESGWQATMAALRSGQGAVTPMERRFARADGTIVHGQVSLSFMPAADSEAPFGICLVEDITARKVAEAALLHQSLHDPLTGLSNRHLFYDRAEHALAAIPRSGRPMGLLYIDLDGFKTVNDSSGHAAGDELLVQVADRLRSSARVGDTVARLGGDEFAMICVDVPDLTTLVQVGERVLAELNRPFRLARSVHRISGSIGVHLAAEPIEPDRLLAAADAAMYRAKAAGRNRVGIAPSAGTGAA
ncbi:MAG: PAS domain S-box protein [Nakamurella sp.]